MPMNAIAHVEEEAAVVEALYPSTQQTDSEDGDAAGAAEGDGSDAAAVAGVVAAAA